MLRSMLIATVAVCTAFATNPTKASQVCGDRAKIVASLSGDYQESRSGIGLASSGAVIELFAAATGSWTILMTAPGGQTCVVGSGDGWENVREPTPVAGEVS